VSDSDKSRLMRYVCRRLSGKQRQMSCFSQGDAATFFQVMLASLQVSDVNFPRDFNTKNY